MKLDRRKDLFFVAHLYEYLCESEFGEESLRKKKHTRKRTKARRVSKSFRRKWDGLLSILV